MPEICRFYGIIIKMFFNDHSPPHFHAEYSGFKAIFNIQTLELISGSMPPKAMGLITEWAALRKDELAADWELARKLQPLKKVEPIQ